MTVIECIACILSSLFLMGMLSFGFYCEYKTRMKRETTLEKFLNAIERRLFP